MTLTEDEATYPGSTAIRRSQGGEGPGLPDDVPQPWEELGQLFNLNGRPIKLYSIGALADALGRRPNTMRHWEQMKIIPPPGLYTDSNSHHGRRRIYTHAQIIGLRQIAVEEGLLSGRRVYVGKTKFQQRAYKLFKELAE